MYPWASFEVGQVLIVLIVEVEPLLELSGQPLHVLCYLIGHGCSMDLD